MNIFYDFEFLEDGRTIDPISVGMVRGDGAEYEAVFKDAPWDRVAENAWLVDNVVPHLPVHVQHRTTRSGTRTTLTPDTRHPAVKPTWIIANEIRHFITSAGQDVELWGDYPAYDHVCLAQLWGTMMDLPEGVPMLTYCVTQHARNLGVDPPDNPHPHDALSDARHTRRVWQHVQDNQ